MKMENGMTSPGVTLSMVSHLNPNEASVESDKRFFAEDGLEGSRLGHHDFIF